MIKWNFAIWKRRVSVLYYNIFNENFKYFKYTNPGKKIKRYEKCKAQFFPVDSQYDYFSENVDNSTIDFGLLHQYL